jgi:hypothetical protein
MTWYREYHLSDDEMFHYESLVDGHEEAVKLEEVSRKPVNQVDIDFTQRVVLQWI